MYGVPWLRVQAEAEARIHKAGELCGRGRADDRSHWPATEIPAAIAVTNTNNMISPLLPCVLNHSARSM